MSESEFSDYVVYVDESGDPNLKKINPNFPVFVLTLCVVKKEVYAEKIIPEMSKFKFRHFGHDMVVLHERDIRKQTGDFKGLLHPENRGIYTQSDSSKKSSRNIWSLAVVSVDQRY